jgi:protein phosphatase
VRDAVAGVGLFERLGSDWVLLDCELMPWSAKAQELLRQQYAAVGAAATGALAPVIDLLDKVAERVPEAAELRDKYHARQANAELFVDAYRRYCWPVTSIADLKLAPFHILASEGAVHIDKDHIWHMQTLAKICSSGLLMRTPYKVIDVTDDTAVAEGIAWWEELTRRGGEGMVVKPLNFVAENNGRLVQPAVKCRGREYLRIIYGPDYTAPDNLDRLRTRSLGAKRSLALREFALGIEALERFTRREPLRRVHECVFGVLALESEPVDPRL